MVGKLCKYGRELCWRDDGCVCKEFEFLASERGVSGATRYQWLFFKDILTVRMVLRDLLVMAVEKSFVDAIVAQVAVK